MRSEAAWSYLSPVPIFVYDPKYDAHLVYWNGVAMTRSYALMIYGVVWCNIYPPESQKKAAWEEYNKIYRSNGFLTRAWDEFIGSEFNYNRYISFINQKNPNFLKNLKTKYSAKEALTWFMPSKELTVK